MPGHFFGRQGAGNDVYRDRKFTGAAPGGKRGDQRTGTGPVRRRAEHRNIPVVLDDVEDLLALVAFANDCLGIRVLEIHVAGHRPKPLDHRVGIGLSDFRISDLDTGPAAEPGRRYDMKQGQRSAGAVGDAGGETGCDCAFWRAVNHNQKFTLVPLFESMSLAPFCHISSRLWSDHANSPANGGVCAPASSCANCAHGIKMAGRGLWTDLSIRMPWTACQEPAESR